MTIDPKVTFYFNIVMAVILWLATGSVTFPDWVSVATAKHITTTCAFFGAGLSTINVALAGYSSPKKGPLVSIAILLLASLFFFEGSGGAVAKTPSPVKRPVMALQTPDQIVAKILNWATTTGSADLDAAIALAKASNNNVTLACWTGIQGFVNQVKALPPPDKLPPVHIAVDVEVATDLEIALLPNSPVIAGCQALANFQKISALNMVTGIVTGALSIAKFAPIIP